MMAKKNEKSKPDLIGPHGGYRNLKSYQTAEIIYDATAIFCDLFVNKRSRTHDQTYVEASLPEVAANTVICLIHQANYLLDQHYDNWKNNSWKKAASQKNFIRRVNRLGENNSEWTDLNK